MEKITLFLLSFGLVIITSCSIIDGRWNLVGGGEAAGFQNYFIITQSGNSVSGDFTFVDLNTDETFVYSIKNGRYEGNNLNFELEDTTIFKYDLYLNPERTLASGILTTSTGRVGVAFEK